MRLVEYSRLTISAWRVYPWRWFCVRRWRAFWPGDPWWRFNLRVANLSVDISIR